MAKMIFEELGGTYIRQGDYFLPCLSLPAEKETKPIGVWGQRHLRYLKQHRKVLYTNLLTSGRGLVCRCYGDLPFIHRQERLIKSYRILRAEVILTRLRRRMTTANNAM